jgi:hypothetical protein
MVKMVCKMIKFLRSVWKKPTVEAATLKKKLVTKSKHFKRKMRKEVLVRKKSSTEQAAGVLFAARPGDGEIEDCDRPSLGTGDPWPEPCTNAPQALLALEPFKPILGPFGAIGTIGGAARSLFLGDQSQ